LDQQLPVILGFTVKHIALLIALFVIIILMMALFERSLIFFPTRYPIGSWDVEAVARGSGCEIEECYFTTDDSVRLHGWWVRRSEESRDDPLLLFFHGNAGNLSDRADLVLELANRLPAQVFVVGYRGYGRSEGKPTEDGLFLDARAAWRFLTDDRGVPGERIVVFGKSLGGAVAVDLAMDVDAAGLIVESSFTSIPEMAARHYPFVPKFLIRTQMNSLSKIGMVSCPKLFVHSRADEVVPYELGRKLYESASQPKAFHEVVGAGHNETWLVGGAPYIEAISGFLSDAG
jgi:fermentation-respiration switch protein FrsA (DUF1100 family)